MKQVFLRVLLSGSVLLGVVAPVAAYAAGEVAPIKPDSKVGAKLYYEGDPSRGVISCVVCHGAKGNSDLAANPNLAAQPHEYLYKQLVEFRPRAGETMAARRGPDGAASSMTALAMPLTEADMRNVSLYLSEQPLSRPAAASSEALVARGEVIWRGGIAAQNVPACAACHTASGAGIPALYPRLAGQYASYLEGQLKLFRANHRANSPMMHQIAYRMSDEDIKAVSDYAAGLR